MSYITKLTNCASRSRDPLAQKGFGYVPKPNRNT